jgi:septal ring factor EnvC (AmiA/AmiB activator)
MSAKDLEQLEDDIKLLRDQLAGKRRTLVTIAPEEQVRIEQQIAELRKKIRNFEQEKWELIAQITSNSDIANDEAEAVVAELVAEGKAIATNPPDDALVLELLQKILGKLNEPDKPAAAKLKGAISALPPFVSLTYEAELDTENTVRKYFPTFSTWTKNLASRLKK